MAFARKCARRAPGTATCVVRVGRAVQSLRPSRVDRKQTSGILGRLRTLLRGRRAQGSGDSRQGGKTNGKIRHSHQIRLQGNIGLEVQLNGLRCSRRPLQCLLDGISKGLEKELHRAFSSFQCLHQHHCRRHRL